LRPEVWNLRTHRCFRALRRALERGCARFGFRLIHFSVQGNYIHFVVEAPDQLALTRAVKGLEVRMARALNRVMHRKGARRPLPCTPAADTHGSPARAELRALQLAHSRGPRGAHRPFRERSVQLGSPGHGRSQALAPVLAALHRHQQTAQTWRRRVVVVPSAAG
jgi:REP element-mobilizing transposase RayT